MLTLTSHQFERARHLALRLAGIELHPRHRDLLGRRGRRAGIHDTARMEALLGAAEDGDPQARREMIGLVTTNFTGFFRHPWHFDIAAEHALWAVHRRGQARLWSAAAATGQEPYSLAVSLAELFQRADPPVRVLATDIDEDALALAKRGEYGDSALRGTTPVRRERFFTRTSPAGRWLVAPTVRRMVEFRALNLAQETWAVEGPLDVIFCRNVLMYLQAAYRDRVVERLSGLLSPDGVLILDPAEYLAGQEHCLVQEAEGVYLRRKVVSCCWDPSWISALPTGRG